MKNSIESEGQITESRRGFFTKVGITLLGVSALPFLGNFAGSVALANELPAYRLKDKKMLRYHGEKPLTAETEIYALDTDFTKPENFFIRNNGEPPSMDKIKARMQKGWTLEISGESVKEPKTYTLDELKKKFKHYTYALTLECGGNGRGEVIPSTKGTQWGYGAVAKFDENMDMDNPYF